MLKFVYAVRDYKVGYTNLVVEENEDVAVRNLKMALRNPDTLFYNEPKDFALFRLATYNTETGDIIPNEPILVAEVYNLISEVRNEVPNEIQK